MIPGTGGAWTAKLYPAFPSWGMLSTPQTPRGGSLPYSVSFTFSVVKNSMTSPGLTSL